MRIERAAPLILQVRRRRALPRTLLDPRVDRMVGPRLRRRGKGQREQEGRDKAMIER